MSTSTPISSPPDHLPATPIPARQLPASGPASGWSPSSPAAFLTESNSYEELTNFFELAGGLYFDPHIGAMVDANGNEREGFGRANDPRWLAGGLDISQAENEVLTKVMVEHL